MSKCQGSVKQQSSALVPTKTAANMYGLPLIARVIGYLHAAVGFPTCNTWLKAIANGHYISWPGITVNNVRKHFPESVETQKGHTKKQRQNVRSTKIMAPVNGDKDVELEQSIEKHNIMVKVINAHNTMFTDQTGQFPVQSSKGNNLLMVFYEVDGLHQRRADARRRRQLAC